MLKWYVAVNNFTCDSIDLTSSITWPFSEIKINLEEPLETFGEKNS